MLTLLLLAACEVVCLPRVGIAMTVCTVEDELPVMAESVVWSLDPDDPAYDGEHALECADRDCSIWYLTEVQDGTVLITGTRTGASDAGECEVIASDTKQVRLDPDQRQVMDLPLVVEGDCP